MIIDFDKRNGGGSGSGYTLPVASETTLGGIKVGQNLTIDSGGTLSADAQAVGVATTATTGVVQVGSGLSITSGGVLSTDIDLSNYATQDELSGYVETSAMSGYVETSAMSGYATTDSLSAYTPSSAMSDYLTVSDYHDDVDDVLEQNMKTLYGDEGAVGMAYLWNDGGSDKAKVFKVTSGGTSVDDYTYYQPSRNTKSPQPEGWVVGKSEQIATIDPSTFSQPAIVIDGTESKFGYMDKNEAHFLVVHGDGLFDEWYDKTEDPETGDITWNSRGLVPIGGGDADKAYELSINDDYSFFMSDSIASGVNCVFTDDNYSICGYDSSDFQQDGTHLVYNTSGFFSVNFHLESIGEEVYGTDITFDHQEDNKLTYTDPMTDGYVEMEYGDDNIFFEDSQVALHVYYQEGQIGFYKSSVSRVALPDVNAQIQITYGYTTEYAGQDTYGVVNCVHVFCPLDYKTVLNENADHVNHVITTTMDVDYYVRDFNDNGILTLYIRPSEKTISVYKNDGSGEEINMNMPCDIDLTDYIPDMAIKASYYDCELNGEDGGTAQIVLVCHDNYNLIPANNPYTDKVPEVPSKFFELIREARTRFYSVINTDNGAFVYEGKDNLTVKNGIEVVDQLPFIGVENKIYMLDNEYQSVSYQPSVNVDSDGNWQEINQVHDLNELAGGEIGIEYDDEGMCYAIGDNGISFAIGDMYQDNQALAVVRIYGNAPEYKVKTFPAFMVSLANDPDNNNEPCYKVAWNFNFLGTDYDNELYLPISGNTTEYVSGEDFDLSGITEDTVTIGTANGEGSYFDLAIEGTEMYVTNGEYVCKDDFAEVGANEMSLYKYKGGRYYQVNGGDDIVAGTSVVVEESISEESNEEPTE